jgi:hypothetical protein
MCASILPKYIPGKPRIVVRNRPGGSGAVALNPFYSRTKPDGLTLLITGAQAVGLQMQKLKVVQFDLTKMGIVGAVNSGGTLVAIRKDALERLTDPQAEPVVCGCREGTEAWNALPIWGREFLGWNVRWILGFLGTSELELAFRRNEIGMFGDSRSITPLVDEGLAEGLAQVGIYSKGKFTRRGDFSDVPTMVELFEEKGKKPTGAAWEAYMAFVGTTLVWKLLLVPPGTPDQALGVLRDAFGKMAEDPKFLKSWKKIISPICDAKVGEEASSLLSEVIEISPEALAYTDKLKREFGILK